VADKKCKAPTEVYQRVTGFFRPVQTYNKGKAEEYRERKTFDVKEVSNVE